MLRQTLLALALAAATPALAADSPTPPAGAEAAVSAGQVLRGADNVRLGRIDRVFPDGSVRVIAGERFAVIPASEIQVVDGKPVTRLSRRDIERLR
ncbi:MAG: hypothetical protein SNJ79_04965 [Sphingomonadaceae bacterium]